MANFGLLDTPYVKIGTSNDVCYCCLKDTCEKERRDAFDVTHELRGRLDNQKVFYIRRSGQDTCICFDCFKKIYENIVAEESPVVFKELPEAEPVEAVDLTATEIKKPTNKKK